MSESCSGNCIFCLRVSVIFLLQNELIPSSTLAISLHQELLGGSLAGIFFPFALLIDHILCGALEQSSAKMVFFFWGGEPAKPFLAAITLWSDLPPSGAQKWCLELKTHT